MPAQMRDLYPRSHPHLGSGHILLSPPKALQVILRDSHGAGRGRDDRELADRPVRAGNPTRLARRLIPREVDTRWQDHRLLGGEEAIATRVEAATSGSEASRIEAITTRIEAATIRARAITTRIEAVTTRIEAIARIKVIPTSIGAATARIEAISRIKATTTRTGATTAGDEAITG